MSNRLKLKVRTKIPAALLGGIGTTVTKDGLTYRIDLDYSQLQDTGDTFDPNYVVVAIWNPHTGDWARVSLTDFINGSLSPAAFDAIAPTTTRGDLIFRNATTNTRLAAGTAGYLLQTNGAGADPSWAGFLQSGTGAATRTWNGKVSDVVTPEDFGAVGDGVADDTTALTNALATGRPVYMTNVYKTTSQVSVTNKAVTIFGGGTILKTAGAGFALSISNTDFTQPVYISGLKILTTQQEADKGLFIGFSELDATGARLQHRCTLRDVEVRGQNVGLHGFLYGIELSNVHRPCFYGVQIAGRQSGSTAANFQNMQRGWNIYSTGAAAPTDYTFVGCQVIAAASAIYGRGHLEGLTFSQCYCIAVNKAWDISLSAAYPWLTASQCHAAVFSTGFELTNVAQAKIHNNLIYRRSEATANTLGVLIASGNDSSVIGNTLLDPGGESGGIFFGIQITDSSRVITASNEFGGANIGVTINGTSSNCSTYDNRFDNPAGAGPLAYQMSGSGTGNVRRNTPSLSVSAQNGGSVTINNTEPAIASVSTDNLEVGDIVTVNVKLKATKDSTADVVNALVRKTSGTATVAFDNSSTFERVGSYSPASGEAWISISARMTVSVRGTCTLALSGFCGLGSATVAAGDGQIIVTRV
ncbi:hypothetical protein [Bradyrhizobium sp. 8-10B]|uniref:right-handed parallel beta-helix repeat-containing protein n=1 Tax=Bradyrhizobium sp. 8-10B TaxID=3344579 RepID=UPI0035C06A0E